MNIEAMREYCLSIKGSSESCPFLDNNIVVFKIMEKMFAFISLMPKDGLFKVYLKCNAEKSVELREQFNGISDTEYKSVLWNAVYLESDVPDSLIKELISHSVEEVVRKLPKSKREEYLKL